MAHKGKKIPDHEVPVILERRAKGEGYAAIARTYGVIPLTIARICNGESRVGLTQGIADVGIDQFLTTPESSEEVQRMLELDKALAAVQEPQRESAMDVFLRARATGKLEIDEVQNMTPKNEVEK